MRHRLLQALMIAALVAALAGCIGGGDDDSIDNLRPTAEIRSVEPSPATVGEEVTFKGRGSDPDGYITEYEWGSSIDGVLANDPTFTTDALSPGQHTIYLRAKDDSKIWYDEQTWSEKDEIQLEILPE